MLVTTYEKVIDESDGLTMICLKTSHTNDANGLKQNGIEVVGLN